MPGTAEVVDAFREVFGPPVAIHAVEGDNEVRWSK